jgi:hypothetical protein
MIIAMLWNGAETYLRGWYLERPSFTAVRMSEEMSESEQY